MAFQQGITNSIDVEFVLIPAGAFLMGTLKAWARQTNTHSIR